MSMRQKKRKLYAQSYCKRWIGGGLCNVWNKQLDNCQVCKGARGGVRGNENVVKGVVMCDYCHCDTLK